MRCDLTDRHTDRPNYSNPRCACAPRVNNMRRASYLRQQNRRSTIIILTFSDSDTVAMTDEILGWALTPTSAFLCLALSQCRFTSWTPPLLIEKSTLQCKMKTWDLSYWEPSAQSDWNLLGTFFAGGIDDDIIGTVVNAAHVQSS